MDKRPIRRSRRSRIVILAGLLIVVALASIGYGLSGRDTSSMGVFKNISYDSWNQYLATLNKQQLNSDMELQHQKDAILKEYHEVSDMVLNDPVLMKNLYLSEKHDGLVNYGSTGNMKAMELTNDAGQTLENNKLVFKYPKEKLDTLKAKYNGANDIDLSKKNEERMRQMKLSPFVSSNSEGQDDRSIPLSESVIPDEESFSKIDPEQFFKGDVTFQKFFSHIFSLISKNHLSHPLQRRLTLENGKPVIDNVLFYEESYHKLSENELYSFFDFPQDFVDDLKIKHENVVNGIPNITPNFYKGDGYVIVGGGVYSWYSLLGIETLRKVGSTLPVEVFLPNKDDYDYQFCEKILPKLNARCIEMYRVFGLESLKDFDVQGYQYKAFALLASSFENAFLLDADAYPVTNPDVLFTSDLYSEYQMITWPDLWRRTTSPVFYEIRRTEIGMVPVRHLNDFFVNPKFMVYNREEDIASSVTYHDRAGTIPDWATESGEMLINKKLHFRSLILALYYNFDGPYGYYPLLSQGGAGEGDKETFVAAANYYNLKYYQVNKKPQRFSGWYNFDSKIWEHSTLVQYNPLSDLELLKTVQTKMRKDMEFQGEDFKYDYDKYYSDVFTPDVCEPMFYHVHDPKMDPFKIIDEGWTYNLEGKKIRNMGEDFPRVDFDLELFIWGVINHYICEMKWEVQAFDGKDWGKLCSYFMKDQLEFLERSSPKIYAAYTPKNVDVQMQGGRLW